MKKLKSMLVTLAMLLCCVSASAEDFSVDSIYYNITDSEKLTVEVTYLGSDYDFYYYSNRYTGSVVIPETVTYESKTYSVTSISWAAFCGCSSLTSVNIPEGVTSIGSEAFEYCSSLTSITIPNSVTSIGAYAFDGTAWYNNQPDGLVYAGKVAYKYKGTMPSNTSIELAEGTLGIAGGAFYFCSSLTSITIGNSVTSIGESAFYNCSSLTSITIPNSVTSIGSSAFYNCSNLTSITIPNSVTSIGGSAFSYCSSLTSITIPNSVTSIGGSAFSYCSSLTSITIPNSVTSIGSSAFENCSSLTSITIPNSVTSIREVAFCNCNSLTSVHISDIAAWCNIEFRDYDSNPLFYAKHLFIDGKEIAELVIPDGVTSIGNYTFCKCSSLTSVTIPDGVTSIGNLAFSGCSSLTSVTIPDGVTSIGYSAFWDCGSLTSVTIPNSVTSIGFFAFDNCSSLTSVTIPNSVTSIGYCTFSGCSSLKSITIPDSVGYIYQEAFANCEGLESVKVLAETPPVAFDNTFSNYEIELCVPEKSVEAYQKTNPWSKFKTFKNLTDIANVKALPVVVQANNGTITVSGADDGTMVEIYGISGAKLGEAKTTLNKATIHTDAQTGSVVIVKVGNKAIKIRI